MNKALEDMTLEELWQLFPIALASHNPRWKDWAKAEMDSISGILAEYSPVINHIGSTAIPYILAKPIIDILVEIDPEADWQSIKAKMEAAGYICMSSSETRMSFNKGYTPQGYAERVFQIHFHALGDNDEILFRDYLNTHPSTASEYEALKSSLLPRYKHNRDGYTSAKTGFIEKVLKLAKIKTV